MKNIWMFLLLMAVPWLFTFGGSMLSVKMPLGTQRRQSILLGFASGVMLASSIWSLILPAFEEAGQDLRGVAIVTIGFLLGCGAMLLLDKVLPHQHMDQETPEGPSSHLSRPMLLVMAVALHNIPEGFALGVVLHAATQPGGAGWIPAIIFVIGLALQNFPEGMAVVLPMRQSGISQKKCALFGTIASFAEPAAALIAFFAAGLLAQLGNTVLPLLLSIAAGAMVFIIVEELIPESQSTAGHGHGPTYGFLAGFWIMVVMAVLGG